MGATEDAARGRAARPGGTDCISPNPPKPRRVRRPSRVSLGGNAPVGRLRSQRRRSQQAEATSLHDRLESRVHVQLLEHAPQVIPDRLGGERELLRDLGRRQARGDQVDHAFQLRVLLVEIARPVAALPHLGNLRRGQPEEEEIVSADFFGTGEFYLGMVAGAFRYACIILVLLALLNARHYSAQEIREENAFQEANFGAIRFPTPITMQSAVFEKSLTGLLARTYLSSFLIRPTLPEEKQLTRSSVVRGRERLVEDVLDKR